MLRRIGDGFMDVVELQSAPFLEVTANHGETYYLPGDLCEATVEGVRDYINGKVEDVVVHDSGVVWRWTAPGYLDCTDWMRADSAESAMEEARAEYEEMNEGAELDA